MAYFKMKTSGDPRFLIAFFLLSIFSCQRVPLTNRRQLKLLPESTLIQASLTQYNQMLRQSPKNSPQEQVDQVKRVGAKISAAVESYLRSNKNSKRLDGIKWEFNVINENVVNAFCMPGGKVAFYSGIFPYTQNDEGVATVMGHEIAHAIARHGNERVSQQLAIQTGLISLDVALSQKPSQTNDLILAAAGLGSQVGILLPFSRLHETEADKLGMVFMAMAGYDPSKTIDFWKRMSKNGGIKPPEFLSTHPSDERRIKDLQEYLPRAKKYYRPS
jgi:predicted Zn-dependent protease